MTNNKYSVGFQLIHKSDSKDTLIRKFSINVRKDDVVWHRDKKERKIYYI